MIFIIIVGLVIIINVVLNYVILDDVETRFTNAISVIEILKSQNKISKESAEAILSQLQWSKMKK